MARVILSKLMRSLLRSKESKEQLGKALQNTKGGHVVHEGRVYSVRLGK